MKIFKLAVTGGRDFEDTKMIHFCLDYFKTLVNAQSVWTELKVIHENLLDGEDQTAMVHGGGLEHFPVQPH